MAIDDVFCRFFCLSNNTNIIGFDASAEQTLLTYSWRGKVCELRNAIERAVILGNAEHILGIDLPESIVPSISSPGSGYPVILSTLEESHIRKILQKTSSIQEAADILGIDQATLWRRRKSYGI
ncbi:AAA-type ATPase lid domain-containing protein [Desulfopila aestuarii]|uniref:Regulatory protein, Fis family n=1 Tax=Desulfopila aestuarii DSM 18488 TaxID=1121416 RepID=A0A1M7YI62_9BACT|nr:helix-turn-helix domain-containing protein [Desulfopila aestuarii]SHO52296.1 regulatory protein, Fis family [Desulfopila aestuarii DSM 18488]